MGEYLGKKPGSSNLFPQYSVMMKSNFLKVQDNSKPEGFRIIKKVRGEIWTGYASKVAAMGESVCHPDGGCVGDIVGINNNSSLGQVSYTGIIAGIFNEGDLAIKLIDGKFVVNGIDANPYKIISRDENIYLFANRSSATFVE